MVSKYWAEQWIEDTTRGHRLKALECLDEGNEELHDAWNKAAERLERAYAILHEEEWFWHCLERKAIMAIIMTANELAKEGL